MSAPNSDQPIFYYDLGSPECYLVAETIMAALPVVPEWEPVHAAAVCDGGQEVDRERIEERVAELELQPLRWPSNWPADTRQVSLAATYAKRVGRAVVFSLATFRQAFAGGQDIGEQSTVLIAGAACEMHPTALLKGIGLRSTAQALEQANDRARGAGVRSLPAIDVRRTVFEGERAVEQAAAALGSRR
ncbi:MAG: DsbA family protein [Solirubrobacteraceae bacterium]